MTQLMLNDLEVNVQLDQEALEGLAGGRRRGYKFHNRRCFYGYKRYYRAYCKHDYYYPKYYYSPKNFYGYGCYNRYS